MGRAMVREPAAFLMDEPLSNLDAKLRVQMRAEIASLQAGLAQGYTVPRGNVEKVLEQLDELLAAPAAKSPFAAIAERDSAPGFGEEVVRVVEREIVPAMARYRAFLADSYLPRARVSTDVASLPGGVTCRVPLACGKTWCPKSVCDSSASSSAKTRVLKM